MTPPPARGSLRGRRGFTLVELLVVVSIIALLISILLPSLRKARDQAKLVKCGANIRAVGLATATYLAENNGVFPVSYRYPTSANGGGSHDSGDETRPFGYVHWSYALFSGGKVKEDAFQCPAYPKGGAPRTDPGPDDRDWEPGQVDDKGQSNPNSLRDWQARRMAYTANAAIIPRNKFNAPLGGGPGRFNVLISETKIRRAGDTILATEFLQSWKAIGDARTYSPQVLVKSHRPVNVFYHLGSAFNEYQAPKDAPGFVYGLKGLPVTPEDYGVVPLSEALNLAGTLDDSSSIPQINAVGRSHPGGDSRFGGTADFVFVDNHVEHMTPLESLKRRNWGDRYYALTGANEVLNFTTR